MRALTVDDQPIFRQAIRATIELTEQFEVCAEAESGQPALDVLANFDLDLVLMDIHMPGLDGLQVARRIREQAPDGHPTVLALVSTYEAADYRRVAAECGADAYISKSELDPELLLSI